MKRRKFILSNILILAGLSTKLSALPFQKADKKNAEPFAIDFIGDTTEYLIYSKAVANMPGITIRKLEKTTVFSNNSKAVIINKTNKNVALLGTEALKQGKHIHINLPDCSFEEYSQMQLQANLQDLRIGVNNPYRYLMSMIIARKYLHTNYLGRVKGYEIKISPEACSNEKGFVGTGSLLVNCITWLSGDTPHSITAKGSFLKTQTANTNLSFTAQLKNVDIKYNIEDRTAKSEWKIKIIGEARSIEIHSNNNTFLVENNGKKHNTYKGQANEYNHAVEALFTDFIKSCKTGKEPEVNSAEILQSILLNQGAKKSTETNKTVQLIEKSYPNSNEQYLMNI